MAKLNSNSSSIQYAAAVAAMSIGTGKRLMRNFQYYRKKTPEQVTRARCFRIYHNIRMNMFGLQNLYLDDNHESNDTSSSFKVMLAKQIQDDFEDLHRKLLFYDADAIAKLIPLLDKQRAFWANSTEPDFYGPNLPETLDRHLLTIFPVIEKQLKSLPLLSEL